MGIPHLTRHLQLYAEPVYLGDVKELAETEVPTVKSVVIDGPSLVYHIYSVLLARSGVQYNAFDQQPTCNEVSVAVVTFLSLLELANVHVAKIYFDGALPVTKRETRLSRLEKCRQRLETYCIAARKGLPAVSSARPFLRIEPTGSLQRLSSLSSAAKKRFHLPENAFIVSTVVEDLKTRWSRSAIRSHVSPELAELLSEGESLPWSDKCEVVPGEADLYCSEYMRDNPEMAVLSSDSDLLIHAMGPQNSVVFLNSLDADTRAGSYRSQPIIKATRICPAALSAKLGIPDLSYFAYALTLNPNHGIRQLIQRAKQTAESRHEQGYTEFLKEFRYNGAALPLHHVESLQGLDARVAELFVQFLQPADSDPPQIYLPFLLEDHSRACAWNVARHIRTLVYSLLASGHQATAAAGPSAVIECVRRGHRFCFDKIDLSSDEQIDSELQTMLDRLKWVRNETSEEVNSPVFWRIYALSELELDEDYDPYVFTRKHLRVTLGLDSTAGIIKWTEIHALAQTHAILYSLRMLSQILNCFSPTTGPRREAQQLLSHLPPLRVLMKSRQELVQELQDSKRGS